MKIIHHRRNTRAELAATLPCHGVEIDIRSWGQELILHHDPYVQGEWLADWLQGYAHGTLILNVKEEGLEERLIELMQAHGIHDYFFLDQSFPFLIRWSGRGVRQCAVRVSEYESVDAALTLAGRVDWVWVDCFTRFPLTETDALRLEGAGFRLCLVSPELQGRQAELELPALIAQLERLALRPAAVCTKRPDLWEAWAA